MQTVEQAIFALPATDDAAGYQVVARSSGVCASDASELAVWGPTHDSMLAAGVEAESLNFHPLPSGAHCISLTSWTDAHRGDVGRSVSTRCLIVPPAVLAHFGNNPFALARAALASGGWQADDWRGGTLDPLVIGGGAIPVDQQLLERLAVEPGPRCMATLVQSAREAMYLAISGTPSPARLIAGLFSCLPPECRLEFSFSTCLKFSPRRPFRIVGLCGDAAERKWVAHYQNVTLLELRANEPPPAMPLDGWAQFIERSLATGQIGCLVAQASKRRFHLTPDDLSALGLQLLEELDAPQFGEEEPIDEVPWHAPVPRGQRTHSAHRQFGKSTGGASTGAVMVGPPSTGLDAGSPEVLEKLELLDDLVYEAIGGCSNTMEELRETWPRISAQLGEPLLAESLEQYLRYAISIWDECSDSDGVRDPFRAIQALDVLAILFGGAA
jgi:hypothetical protein